MPDLIGEEALKFLRSVIFPEQENDEDNEGEVMPHNASPRSHRRQDSHAE